MISLLGRAKDFRTVLGTMGRTPLFSREVAATYEIKEDTATVAVVAPAKKEAVREDDVGEDYSALVSVWQSREDASDREGGGRPTLKVAASQEAADDDEGGDGEEEEDEVSQSGGRESGDSEGGESEGESDVETDYL